MTVFLLVLALLWGLPIIVALLVALATYISPPVNNLVREVLFGTTS